MLDNDTLFRPLNLGAIKVPNRILMAPPEPALLSPNRQFGGLHKGRANVL
jgi:2,4-dienoyl-CoA reductase-like NADH-dependent reductase (Old Yellow Enzyme family)